MNYLDIIIALPLLWGAYKGFTKGLIIEAASLAALLLGIYGAIKFSGITSDFLVEKCNFSSQYLHIISFAITFILIVIAVHFIARLINKLVKAVALGFVNNFGLKNGAIASSVAHDSHNIIAVGTSDKDVCRAVNLIIENKGGICAVSSQKEKILPLPIAGIISDRDYLTVAQKYSEIDAMVKALGSNLDTPLMTLSFMALLVIPELKLSDKGLFDGNKFEFADVFE